MEDTFFLGKELRYICLTICNAFVFLIMPLTFLKKCAVSDTVLQFPGDKPGHAESPVSHPLNPGGTKRGANPLPQMKLGEIQQNHRMVPSSEADAMRETKMIDLNMKPHKIDEQTSNNQVRFMKIKFQLHNLKHQCGTAHFLVMIFSLAAINVNMAGLQHQKSSEGQGFNNIIYIWHASCKVAAPSHLRSMFIYWWFNRPFL